MLAYVRGDLLNAPQICIIHGCNNRGVFNAGVARAIRHRYPAAYRAYMEGHRAGRLVLGNAMFVPCGDRLIVNAIVQDGYGRDGRRYVVYEAMEQAFSETNRVLTEKGFDEIAMPKIGAGLGGGDWQVISQIIEKQFQQLKPVIYSLDQ